MRCSIQGKIQICFCLHSEHRRKMPFFTSNYKAKNGF
jgi:hypothetical protein